LVDHKYGVVHCFQVGAGQCRGCSRPIDSGFQEIVCPSVARTGEPVPGHLGILWAGRSPPSKPLPAGAEVLPATLDSTTVCVCVLRPCSQSRLPWSP
jgi:hypothetical protein